MKYIIFLVFSYALLYGGLKAEEIISLDAESAGLKSQQVELLDLVHRGQYAKARDFLKNYNINDRTESGITLLWWAANSGDLKSFIFFLENGASPLSQTLDTYNIMELCASQEDKRFLKLALEHGGNANLISHYRRVTPIFLSVQHHRVDNVRVLLDSGATVNIADTTGRTPALWASEGNAFEILLLLLKAGADPYFKDIWGLNVIESLNEKELAPSNPRLSQLKEAVSFIETAKVR